MAETASSWIATSDERRWQLSGAEAVFVLGETCSFNPVSDRAEAEAWPMRPRSRRRRLASASVADWADWRSSEAIVLLRSGALCVSIGKRIRQPPLGQASGP